MAHWFQTASVQRKQLTSICQNYNGTAAEGDRGLPSVHCQRQTGRPRLISSFYSYQELLRSSILTPLFIILPTPLLTYPGSEQNAPVHRGKMPLSKWQQILPSKIKRCTNNTFAPTSLQWYHHIKADNNI